MTCGSEDDSGNRARLLHHNYIFAYRFYIVYSIANSAWERDLYFLISYGIMESPRRCSPWNTILWYGRQGVNFISNKQMRNI